MEEAVKKLEDGEILDEKPNIEALNQTKNYLKEVFKIHNEYQCEEDRVIDELATDALVVDLESSLVSVNKLKKKRKKSSEFFKKAKKQKINTEIKRSNQKKVLCKYFLMGSCHLQRCKHRHVKFNNSAYKPLCSHIKKKISNIQNSKDSKADFKNLCPKKNCNFSHFSYKEPCLHFFNSAGVGTGCFRRNCVFSHDSVDLKHKKSFEVRYPILNTESLEDVKKRLLFDKKISLEEKIENLFSNVL